MVPNVKHDDLSETEESEEELEEQGQRSASWMMENWVATIFSMIFLEGETTDGERSKSDKKFPMLKRRLATSKNEQRTNNNNEQRRT
ncbi:unnamed protein product [Haemonchus placei]|uniref:Uncharacterized protein n=1 Tax=Haemonchus placei TaxID=6290 RepID=A0A0N4WSU0_HAEPC|nr:unnamed protein product [Haemonchus placei]